MPIRPILAAGGVLLAAVCVSLGWGAFQTAKAAPDQKAPDRRVSVGAEVDSVRNVLLVEVARHELRHSLTNERRFINIGEEDCEPLEVSVEFGCSNPKLIEVSRAAPRSIATAMARLFTRSLIVDERIIEADPYRVEVAPGGTTTAHSTQTFNPCTSGVDFYLNGRSLTWVTTRTLDRLSFQHLAGDHQFEFSGESRFTGLDTPEGCYASTSGGRYYRVYAGGPCCVECE